MSQAGFRRVAVLVFLTAGISTAQTRIDLRSQGRNVDFADAAATRPFAVGTTLPATCTTGSAFFKSDAPAGKNLYLCTAANVWTLSSGDNSVVTVAGLPAAAGNAGRVYIVSDARDKGDCSAGGGSVFTACVSDGSSWSPVAGARPPFVQDFPTAATTWTVSGATHGRGTQIEVFVQSDDGTAWRRADPSEVTIHKTTGDVTVTWSTATAGRMLITTLTGTGASGGGGAGGTNDHAQLLNLDYANSGHTGFERAMHAVDHMHGGDDEIATATPQAYGIPKAGPSGQLDRNWLPVMQGDTGAGGARGVVPAPAPGDAGRCLKGDGTWGDCGAAGTGDNVTVNSTAVSDANLNNTTPAAPANARNVIWQADSASPANISAYVPVMTGDAGSGGQAGLVPAPQAGDAAKCLKGDGTWGACGTGSGPTILDEGTALPQRSGLNFTGAGIACTDNAASNRTDCTVSGGSGGAGAANPLTVAADPNYDGERTIQVGPGIQGTDNGPNSSFRIEVDPTYVVTQGGNNDLSGNNKLNLGLDYLSISLANNSSTGTSANRLVSVTGAPGTAVLAPAGSDKIVGICVGNCGTTGTARVAIWGRASCVFDGATVAGNWVASSTTTAGNCRDAGPSKPTSGLVGIALTTNASAGTYEILIVR